MATHNDITGDKIQSKVNSKEFEANFDFIFRNHKEQQDLNNHLLEDKEMGFND